MSSVRLVFFGTGSGKPTPTRNVSSVALFRDGDMFMFDCGEGTQVQLAKSTLRPGTIEGIFLTHFHGDHINGLPGLMGTLTLNQREDKLIVSAPTGLKAWFKTMRQVGILRPNYPVKLTEINEPMVVHSGDGWRIEAHKLDHRVPCFGYAFIEDARPGRFDLDAARALGVPPGPLFGKLQRGEQIELEDGTIVTPDQVLGDARPGLKVAYCCDTIPCEGAIELARDADVLIHESTYPAGNEREAHKRGHSTSGDAARCAKKAGAHKLILTHFSQKHLRAEEFLKGARPIFENVVAAKDFSEIEVTRREA